MSWIRLDSEYPRHRKTLRLVRKLGQAAELYPIRLWLWAARQSPMGSLRDIDAEEVAMIVGHPGSPEELLEALLACGFVEEVSGERRLTSWYEHNGILADRRERNAKRMKRARAQHVLNTCGATYVRTYVRKDKDKDVSPAPKSADADSTPASKTILEFPTTGKVKNWVLTEAQVSEWKTLYPGLPVEAECRKALAWIKASPSRRKTTTGMGRFLVGWLNKAVNAPSRASNLHPSMAYELPPGSPGAIDVDGDEREVLAAALEQKRITASDLDARQKTLLNLDKETH